MPPVRVVVFRAWLLANFDEELVRATLIQRQDYGEHLMLKSGIPTQEAIDEVAAHHQFWREAEAQEMEFGRPLTVRDLEAARECWATFVRETNTGPVSEELWASLPITVKCKWIKIAMAAESVYR